MVTLHIEHPISDLATWYGAFQAFAEARGHAGVTRESVRQPVDDPHYIVVELDFATVDQARAFESFLRDQVWVVPENAPALAGTPTTMILAAASAP